MPAVCLHRHPGVPLRFLPESRRFSEGEAPPRHMGNPPRPSDRKRERPGMQNSRSKPPSGLLRPFFRQQYLPACLKARKQAVITRSSRSPDLRIHSRRTAFSGSLPMTDFRHVRGLHAYSGGTVPDSHRIHYSPPKSTGISAALKRFLIYQNDTPIFPVCQEDLRIFRSFLSRPEKMRTFFIFPFTKRKSSVIMKAVLNTARWCSRLARQPVTLEVDGSSPFRVAKNAIPFGMAFFFSLNPQPSGCKPRRG